MEYGDQILTIAVMAILVTAPVGKIFMIYKFSYDNVLKVLLPS